MNTTRAKRRLVKAAEGESYLKYNDDSLVSDNDEVLIYGERRDNGDGVRWKVREVHPVNQKFVVGEDIEEQKGIHQLVLRGTARVSEAVHGHNYELVDVSCEQVAPIEKNKDEIKHKIVQVARLGLPNKYVINGMLADSSSVRDIGSNLQPLQEDDFKVTTVRKQTKAMHLGRGSYDDEYLYKLGVNWRSWHASTPTQKFKTLSHELIHCLYLHHKESFYIAHAELISHITKSETRKERVEHLFGDIHWNKLKTLVMQGVHDQPGDIDISEHPNRRSACEEVVGKLGKILDYNYEVGKTFHTHPPSSELLPKWVQEYTHDGNGDYPSREELRPDGVEMRKVLELDFDDDYTDDELYDYLIEVIHEEDEDGFTKLTYGEEDLPVVSGTQIVQNEKLASLFKRMINDSDVVTEDGFSPEVKMPVLIADSD